MKQSSPRQIALALPTMVTLTLAAAVFLWGAQYKCSLYHAHPNRHPRIAMAKLLSERERPDTNNGAKSLPGRLARVVFFAPQQSETAPIQDRRTGLLSTPLSPPGTGSALRISFQTHFSFRPPPRLVS
jgi:hypothetical protein